jgi:hypothetical protein
MKRVYKTMQGRIVDLDKLSTKNELTPAIGNMRVNARGDELGPGGKIIRKREDIVDEYYRNNPNAVPDEIARRRPNVIAKQPAQENVTPIDGLTSEDIEIPAAQTDITKRKRNGE